MTEPNLDHIHESLRHLAVAVDGLTPDPKNARKHDRRNLDAIKASLEKFGFRQPIIVQKQGMIVRAGNGRLEVSKELGWTHVPALIVDEAEAEAVAYAIADNRTAELAEWDWENLTALLQGSTFEWSDMKLFDDSELELLFLESDKIVELDAAASANIDEKVQQQMNTRSGSGTASKELDAEEFDAEEFDHQCPRCKFRFND